MLRTHADKRYISVIIILVHGVLGLSPGGGGGGTRYILGCEGAARPLIP